MSFVIETGAGTPGANAYTNVAFVTAYLTDRSRETQNTWSASAAGLQQAAIVAATDYIDKTWGPRFKGSRLQLSLPTRPASGTIALSANAQNGDTFTLGQRVYRLVTAIAQEDDVLIGADVTETLQNLANAINEEESTNGTSYSDDTVFNAEALAADAESSELDVAARVAGENGNLIAFSTDIAGATLTGSDFLEGALDGGAQPLQFPRRELYNADGRPVVGIPLKLRQATAEYAVRAIAASLDPDPTVDDSGRAVIGKREKVGPIEEETTYASSGELLQLIRPYPAADRLLAEYTFPPGRLYRG